MLSVIKKRYSTRIFKDARPPKSSLKKILEAGRWAPSGLNNQPWRFLTISDKNTKNKISEFTEYRDIVKNAPVLIIVLMDKLACYNYKKDTMAIGACIENMLLEASSLRIGSCWLGEILNNEKKVINFLKIKKHFELMAVIAVGYPKTGKKHRTKRKPLKKLLIKNI